MRSNLLENVLKTVRNFDMIQSGDRVLAAVSGGPDSVFLLHALNRLRGKLGLTSLAACNLDHGLRGDESRDDSLFVRKLCKTLKVKFIHKRIDLRKIKSKSISTEEAGREERYKFFKEVAGETGSNVIATGHTLDDQAETILMRLVKGASLKGMVGISPVREEPPIRIIRPLLELEKKEISNFLDEHNIQYRMDRTNLEPVYFRNIVRSEIIPFMERYNPRLKRALFNLAEHLREDFEFIREEKSRRAKRLARGGKDSVEIRIKDIAVQPKAIQKEILRDALSDAGGEVKRLSFRHWKDVEHFIRYNRRGGAIDLPGDVRVTKTDRTLVFHKI